MPLLWLKVGRIPHGVKSMRDSEHLSACLPYG
jgi:hypothetical protein